MEPCRGTQDRNLASYACICSRRLFMTIVAPYLSIYMYIETCSYSLNCVHIHVYKHASITCRSSHIYMSISRHNIMCLHTYDMLRMRRNTCWTHPYYMYPYVSVHTTYVYIHIYICICMYALIYVCAMREHVIRNHANLAILGPFSAILAPSWGHGPR